MESLAGMQWRRGASFQREKSAYVIHNTTVRAHTQRLGMAFFRIQPHEKNRKSFQELGIYYIY